MPLRTRVRDWSSLAWPKLRPRNELVRMRAPHSWSVCKTSPAGRRLVAGDWARLVGGQTGPVASPRRTVIGVSRLGCVPKRSQPPRVVQPAGGWRRGGYRLKPRPRRRADGGRRSATEDENQDWPSLRHEDRQSSRPARPVSLAARGTGPMLCTGNGQWYIPQKASRSG
jgi:hypothetical protein